MAESTRGAGGTILVLPIVDWEFRTQRPHHLARHFARAGHRVLYPDLRLGAGRHGTEVEPGIVRFQFPGRPGFDPYREMLTAEDVTLAMLTLEGLDEQSPLAGLWVVAQLPSWAPLAMAARRRFGGAVLFDCMDDFAHFGDHGDLSGEEAELARGADLVAVSSQPLLEKLAPLARRIVLVRNGCEPDRFLPPAAAPEGPPVVGFFGGIHDWFDAALVAEVARRRPDWLFRFVGDTYRGDVAALRPLRNVELLGELPYADLPGVAAGFHVGIVPFRVNPLTRAADPVKVYEMLALGLAVVATPLPELERLRPHVRLAPDGAAFEREIEAALAEPFERRAERRAAALGESWTARYETLRGSMSEVPGASPIRQRDLWRERAAIEGERNRLARRAAWLETEVAVYRDESARFRADRDAVAGRLDLVTSTRWWRLGERYWRLRRRLKGG